MATERKIFALSILCIVVQAAVCLQVNIPQKTYEYARGDNITIPCKFTPKNPTNGLVVITWTAKSITPDQPDEIVLTSYSTVPGVDVTDTYEGRAILEEDIPAGKANLRLLSIGLQDNMDFECHILIPGDDKGVLAATTRLIVLVAPSPPLCKVQGLAEYGQNINLTCVSAEGSPTPTYSWQRRDVTNAPRPQDGRTTDKNGLLSLFNVSTETSGYYICTSTNKIRSATCNVTLSVMPPSMNLGYTAGIAGGVVAAILLLILIICCCRRRRNKNKGQEDYEMGAPDDEFSDKEPQEGRGEEVRSVEPPRNAERRNERDYDDRRSDYDDRRSDVDDRRSDYTDRRSDYTDRRSDYDARDNNADRRDRYDDRRDRDYKDDRYDGPYDDRPPRVPANKPVRKDYDD
ncbi:cell surface A33 antigen-like [Hypomesus transpacificus]|uniref:cell surface A33 antigen-like n=1 Tax=Hypomesus transpacificus TaxID=137520 RepID=UPI001F076FA6|nr:cell surface A33 antigen-like [Hypomesus transpacificus]